MIYKNRKWIVGHTKCRGLPFKFGVEWDNQINENVLVKLPFRISRFSIEELEDMIAILKKVNKETRKDTLK